MRRVSWGWDPGGGLRIDPLQLGVEAPAALGGGPLLQAPAQVRVPGPVGKVEALDDCPDIQAGAPHQHRNAPPPVNVPGGGVGRRLEGRHVEALVAVDHIDQVVADPPALLRRRLGGADVETAVKLG